MKNGIVIYMAMVAKTHPPKYPFEMVEFNEDAKVGDIIKWIKTNTDQHDALVDTIRIENIVEGP